jgi:DNA-binding response OmpR family regulator
MAAKRVTRRDNPDRLTPTEWHLLEVLTRHPGSLVTGKPLLQEVWGPPMALRRATCGSTWPNYVASSNPNHPIHGT